MNKNRAKQKLLHKATVLEQKVKYGVQREENNDLSIPLYQKYKYMYKKPKLDAEIFEAGVDDYAKKEDKNPKQEKKMKFQPYDQRSFLGAGVKFDSVKKKSGKVRFGPDVSTPTIDEQKALDPTNWKENPNFIPILKENNKMLKLKDDVLKGKTQNWEKYLTRLQNVDELEHEDKRK